MHPTCVGEVTLHFQLDVNTLGSVSFPTDSNLKARSRTNARAVPRKPFSHLHILIWIFSLFWCGEFTSEVCPHILDTIQNCYWSSLYHLMIISSKENIVCKKYRLIEINKYMSKNLWKREKRKKKENRNKGRQTEREKWKRERKNNIADSQCGLERCIATRGLRYPSRLVYG